MSVTIDDTVLTRSDAEDFLFREAEILEANDLDAWLALFEEGGRYQVPTTDAPADADPTKVQFFIADDWDLLNARVLRLQSRNAHAENPRSHTHRLIGNVRVAALGGREDARSASAPPAHGSLWSVRASFVIHRLRDGRVDPYLGRYDHTLVATDDGLRFRLRRSWLATESVQPGGRLSFIL